jgi:protein-S-isoprenylcysteine O-methyltransferase Ste14
MSIYRFNMREESVALGQALVAFTVVMLIMIGIAGTVYRVIAPDGWIVSAFDRGLGNGLAALGLVGLLAALLWMKGGGNAFAKRSTATEVVVAGFAGLGALFLLQGVLSSLQ